MKKLTEIGLRTNTDKAYLHQFTDFYEDIFSQFTSPRILEIGVFEGASINMYLEYFDNPYIVGIDTQPIETDGRWKMVKANQSSVEELQNAMKGEDPFDIIVDDGGHTLRDQQISFGELFKYVKSGGYYILEDLHTSFMLGHNPYYEFIDCKYTSYEMIRLVQLGIHPFSELIDIETQKEILARVDHVIIYGKVRYCEKSITSVIKAK